MNELKLSDVELMRLDDCATSTRCGMVDKGFPKALGKLASLRLVEAKNGGYIVTTLGLELLKAEKIRIVLPKRKAKKCSKWEIEFENDGE